MERENGVTVSGYSFLDVAHFVDVLKTIELNILDEFHVI